MGLTALGTLIMIVLSLLAQSPQLLLRLGLHGRLEAQARLFTGYALALLLLMFGFFLAGVPLGASVETIVVTSTLLPDGPVSVTITNTVVADALVTPSIRPTSLTPESGAFGGPPEEEAENTPTVAVTEAFDPTTTATSSVTLVPLATETDTATATATATATNSPTPTTTPTPTVTPTPIVGETAVVNTSGSTLWVYRSPGGQQLVVVRDQDIVILLPGHALRNGLVYRQVSTVEGIVGWVEEEFLSIETS